MIFWQTHVFSYQQWGFFVTATHFLAANENELLWYEKASYLVSKFQQKSWQLSFRWWMVMLCEWTCYQDTWDWDCDLTYHFMTFMCVKVLYFRVKQTTNEVKALIYCKILIPGHVWKAVRWGRKTRGSGFRYHIECVRIHGQVYFTEVDWDPWPHILNFL